jgi:hypothetical protein
MPRRIARPLSSLAALVGVVTLALVGAGTAAAADPNPGDVDHRAAYCLGSRFLDLVYKQPELDKTYEGAVLAWYVQGKGLTCDAPPPGYVAFTTAPDEFGIPGQLYAWWVPAGTGA